MKLSRLFRGHLCMFSAEVLWGLMAPIGKDAMTHGISGMDMVSFRTVGGALCFWVASCFVHTGDKVSRRDLFLLALAAMLSIVLNQCCYIVGLSLTSPINASIVTTSMPIFTLLLGLLFRTEHLSWRKALGLSCGISGALSLILSSATTSGMQGGDIRGDLLCMFAQLSFASYLALFGRLISRYHVVTCMKWMFTFAACVTLPLSASSLSQLPWAEVASIHWAETAYVVLGATFFSYLLMMQGQKVLTPTQVSVYNYVQPVVSAALSVLIGLAVLGWMQGLAVLLVFVGVRLVARKK